MPKYECLNSEGDYYPCKNTDTCEMTAPFNKELNLPTFRVNWNSEYSLYNYVEILDLRCATSFELGLFAAFNFLGLVSGFSLAKYGDIYGRIS